MATKATGKDSIAFGGGAVATEENALAIGAFSESKGKNLLQLVPVQRHKKIMQLLLGTKQKLVSKAA